MIEGVATRSENRGVRRFHKKVDKFVEQRERLLEKGKFSLEPKLGQLAIHVATAADLRSHLSPEEQRRVFQEEGECLQEHYMRLGVYNDVKLVPNTNSIEMGFDIRAKDVAGIVTIGHGNIGNVWMPSGEGHFDWEDAARKSRRLKLGHIIQRTCGNVRERQVPWGTFIAADQTKILAALGHYIPEEHPPDELFKPVFTTPHNDREQILAKIEPYIPKPEA